MLYEYSLAAQREDFYNIIPQPSPRAVSPAASLLYTAHIPQRGLQSTRTPTRMSCLIFCLACERRFPTGRSFGIAKATAQRT